MASLESSASLTKAGFAERYVLSTHLEDKVSPAAVPASWGEPGASLDLRPGRPSELVLTKRRSRGIKLGAHSDRRTRAELHHRFWQHELQAAELMCWAALRFPDTPESFRDGLFRIFQDEVRHMSLYQAHIESLGFGLSDFEVRDWFWDRVPACQTPVQFVALLGMGLEGANLDHTARFETWLRAVGDTQGAEIQRQVGREEIAHVRFATRWFHTWTGKVDFETWRAQLPAPLSPMLMRGKTIERDKRLRAAYPSEFLDRLAAYEPNDRAPSESP